MKSLFHLPAHPLFVHAPVVLMPLVALFALALALRRDWRERYIWQFVASCAVLLGATLLAARTGEAFNTVVKDSVPTKKHQDLADTTRIIVALLFLASLGVVASIRRDLRATARDPASSSARRVSRLASWAAAAISVIGTIWMIRTGHEGARMVWSGTLKRKG